MFEFAHYIALASPIVALAAAFVVFRRRCGKKNENGYRSLGLYVLGLIGIGIPFYVSGLILGSQLACKGAKYAECTLGGIILVGPLSFSLGIAAYIYFWGRHGMHPNKSLKNGTAKSAAR
jgi:hypothetical protein